ncbi:hypothetical protein [Nostoc sp. PCC 7120 = FACHB-418]|nr:hypothetical protein [Nostoc sp. PCC 7120 = FACHB-418]
MRLDFLTGSDRHYQKKDPKIPKCWENLHVNLLQVGWEWTYT